MSRRQISKCVYYSNDYCVRIGLPIICKKDRKINLISQMLKKVYIQVFSITKECFIVQILACFFIVALLVNGDISYDYTIHSCVGPSIYMWRNLVSFTINVIIFDSVLPVRHISLKYSKIIHRRTPEIPCLPEIQSKRKLNLGKRQNTNFWCILDFPTENTNSFFLIKIYAFSS